MHPDNTTAGSSPTGRSPRGRGKGRHFRPSRRKPPAVPAAAAGQKEPPVDVDEIESAAEPAEPLAGPVETLAEEPARRERPERPAPVRDKGERERIEREPPAPAGPPAITRAIEHVQQVITDLQGALEEMELALEILEEAEREKLVDERELSALQRALERVNRFRGGQRSSERSPERPADRQERSSERSR